MAKMEQITTKTKIAGYEKEVAQLEQLKDFLHNAEKYANCGVHIPKGVLLYGYPGVGKTVMAKSIADEHINIVELRAADCTRDNSEEFIQEAFAKAKEMKPCLLLIDEFDKIAGCRDEFYMEMNDKAMKILLQELDSLKEENGVLVVATCNDIRRLGPALVRSGRFDRIFEIGLPSLEDRKKILSLYYDKITMEKSLDVDYVARVTSGYSGAQLECLVNESGMNREGKKCLLYSRVSTEMQVEGYSLEAQKNCLKRFAEREEMTIVDAYEDAGKSGKSIEGRPAFKRMLSDIENGKNVDYVLVYKLSRFGRNAADILNSLALLQTYDVNLICIEEGIDSSQTSGKLLISVLSAVAEIERENILEQTMNGRREKARQGKWNGGPAPYGYTINDGVLQIDEEEAKIVKTIYEMYVNTKIGYTGIAKYLNLQGITKRPRKESDAKVFSGHFIQILLDNPVYCGKIAYGRRKHERIKGKKNEYHVVHQKEFSLTDGLHEGIVSKELWEKARDKRVATGIKLASKIGKDRTYLLTGILKCPKCGSPMYANRIRWTKKDGTEKEVMYYSCSRNKLKRGGFCDYSANLKKTDIEPLVVGVLKQIMNNKKFVEGVKNCIGIHVDAYKIVEEIKNYEAKLKEVQLNKNRLETELDTLPIDAKYKDRKIRDMTTRIDSMYDVIAEIEEKIDDARYRKQAIEEKSLTFENIYRILVHFSKIYDKIGDEDRKELLAELIKEIRIYPEGENEYPLKSIKFAFPRQDEQNHAWRSCGKQI